jgi:acyl carrier protein
MNAPINEIRTFLCENLLIEQERLATDQPLFSSGMIDPDVMLYLVMFLEEQYRVVFSDEEIDLVNFDTVERIAASLARKTGPCAE